MFDRHAVGNSLCRLIALVVVSGLFMGPAFSLTLSEKPMFTENNVAPYVMLDVSKDQQLYKKAYNDYSDLDGDGQLETTYKHSINYYGYFDPYKCYDYTSNRFEPVANTANKYCSGYWSGNFLNWATMTRMDAVRKLLYGGYRSTDTSTETVVERAFMPTDAHSFAKYYNGSDISQLTPFSVTNTPSAVGTNDPNNSAGIGTGLKKFRVGSNTSAFALGDQVIIRQNGSSSNYMIGAVSCVKGAGMNMYNSVAANSNSCSSSDNEIGVVVESTGGTTGGTNKNWDIYNYSQVGITICNTTAFNSGSQNSQSNTNPPLMRVAKGNFALWAANERWQCLWREDSSSPGESTGSLSGATRTNGNRAALSGLFASSIGPNKSTTANGRIDNGLGSDDYHVRVKVCDASFPGTEKCKQYPSGNIKPIGLLQYYGDNKLMKFGLMTGSYRKNISGGALRKNVDWITDEINTATDGTFTSTVGIIKTLDRMRIVGYWSDTGSESGLYNNAWPNGDSCSWQLTNITENNCTSWGNPMSELYYESLRYFAGRSSTSAYTYTAGSTKDDSINLPLATWTNGSAFLNNQNYCTPLNVLVFNASVSTNDFDLASTSMSDINSGNTAAGLADVVGSGEGIAGEDYFIGSTGSTGASNNELCDSKTVSNLGSIKGICPEGPTLLGSYLMPGMAHHARTNRIRTDLTVPDNEDGTPDTTSLKVATYGVQLATNVPRIPVALQNETTPRVVLQPAYLMFESAPQGGGQLVDMKIVSQTATSTVASGRIYVNWEDSEQGGDYDQDVWGLLDYCLTTVDNGCGTGTAANRIYVTTKTIAESTGQPQGFGYTISGTTEDGPHFHSGIEGFDYTDPQNISVSGGSTNSSGGCRDCQLSNSASTAIFTLGATPAGNLHDPLYYAAKWGGFNDADGDGEPSSTSEWDVLGTDGSSGSDGIPDNYFYVSNPTALETAMEAAFLKILRDASASAVATNSSSLKTESRVYQARFSGSDWSGQLLSYKLDPTTGSVVSAASLPPGWDPDDTPWPEWNAGYIINSQAGTNSDSRVIITKGSTGDGVAFAWSNLTSGTGSQQEMLNAGDGRGADRVGYLRGQSQHEGVTAGSFRKRPVSRLGDIVNSNPWYVGVPSAGYSDVDYAGYKSFATTYKNRMPVVYVGANDGMLHGFNVDPTATNKGKEVIAYVPTPVYSKLSGLTSQNYVKNHKYTVDGSPMVADAYTNSSWKTVLVGSLNAGGRGYFALDVTYPDSGFTQANAASLLLWEFTDQNDSDLGYTFSHPPSHLATAQAKQIDRLANGKWAAIVGNGYNSGSGHAALFVLFLEDGEDGTWSSGDYVKLTADDTGANGLSTPVPIDTDGDGYVDTAYAGDLKGNVWKFLIGPNGSDATVTSNPATWKVADFGGAGPTPLFQATDSSNTPQPIIYPPEVTLHPTAGVLVLVGTGKYLEVGDAATTATQSFYGLWDKDDGSNTIAGRSELKPHVIGTIDVSGRTYRTLSAGCDSDALTTSIPDCPTSPLGWYMDFPISGERLTGIPKLEDEVIFFNTFIPSTAPCEFGGTGWLMALYYYTGGIKGKLFDTNDDSTINESDTAVAGLSITAIGGTTLITGATAGSEGVLVSSTPGGQLPTHKWKSSAQGRGRITWREIIE